MTIPNDPTHSSIPLRIYQDRKDANILICRDRIGKEVCRYRVTVQDRGAVVDLNNVDLSSMILGQARALSQQGFLHGEAGFKVSYQQKLVMGSDGAPPKTVREIQSFVLDTTNPRGSVYKPVQPEDFPDLLENYTECIFERIENPAHRESLPAYPVITPTEDRNLSKIEQDFKSKFKLPRPTLKRVRYPQVDMAHGLLLGKKMNTAVWAKNLILFAAQIADASISVEGKINTRLSEDQILAKSDALDIFNVNFFQTVEDSFEYGKDSESNQQEWAEALDYLEYPNQKNTRSAIDTIQEWLKRSDKPRYDAHGNELLSGAHPNQAFHQVETDYKKYLINEVSKREGVIPDYIYELVRSFHGYAGKSNEELKERAKGEWVTLLYEEAGNRDPIFIKKMKEAILKDIACQHERLALMKGAIIQELHLFLSKSALEKITYTSPSGAEANFHPQRITREELAKTFDEWIEIETSLSYSEDSTLLNPATEEPVGALPGITSPLDQFAYSDRPLTFDQLDEYTKERRKDPMNVRDFKKEVIGQHTLFPLNAKYSYGTFPANIPAAGTQNITDGPAERFLSKANIHGQSLIQLKYPLIAQSIARANEKKWRDTMYKRMGELDIKLMNQHLSGWSYNQRDQIAPAFKICITNSNSNGISAEVAQTKRAIELFQKSGKVALDGKNYEYRPTFFVVDIGSKGIGSEFSSQNRKALGDLQQHLSYVLSRVKDENQVFYDQDNHGFEKLDEMISLLAHSPALNENAKSSDVEKFTKDMNAIKAYFENQAERVQNVNPELYLFLTNLCTLATDIFSHRKTPYDIEGSLFVGSLNNLLALIGKIPHVMNNSNQNWTTWVDVVTNWQASLRGRADLYNKPQAFIPNKELMLDLKNKSKVRESLSNIALSICHGWLDATPIDIRIKGPYIPESVAKISKRFEALRKIFTPFGETNIPPTRFLEPRFKDKLNVSYNNAKERMGATASHVASKAKDAAGTAAVAVRDKIDHIFRRNVEVAAVPPPPVDDALVIEDPEHAAPAGVDDPVDVDALVGVNAPAGVGAPVGVGADQVEDAAEAPADLVIPPLPAAAAEPKPIVAVDPLTGQPMGKIEIE